MFLTGTDNVGNTSTGDHGGQGRHLRPGSTRAWCWPLSADEFTPQPPPSTAPPAAGAFDVTASSTDRAVPGSSTTASRPGRLHRPGPAPPAPYTLARTPYRSQRRQAVTARNQALLSSTATKLHPHLRRRGPDRRRAHGELASPLRRRHPELRQRRHLHHRARTDYTDAASGLASSTLTRETRHAQRRRLLGLRRPTTLVGHPPERPRHRLLPLRPHRHRQPSATNDLGSPPRQGRHHRAAAPTLTLSDTSAGRLYDRNDRASIARRQRRLRRRRAVHRRPVPGILDYVFPVSPASRPRAGLDRGHYTWRRRPSRTARRR
jgi:hypothetical protein